MKKIGWIILDELGYFYGMNCKTDFFESCEEAGIKACELQLKRKPGTQLFVVQATLTYSITDIERYNRSKATYPYKGVSFDDFVKEDNRVWSQVCNKCIEKYYWEKESLSETANTCTCGVKGCNNNADYYINFK